MLEVNRRHILECTPEYPAQLRIEHMHRSLAYPCWIENPQQVNAWIFIEIQGYPNGYS